MFQISEVVLLKIVQFYSNYLNFKVCREVDGLFFFVISVEKLIFASFLDKKEKK